MYQDFGPITLKTGETVQAGVVLGPDADWQERLVALLSHKGDAWNWQNAEVLRADLGIQVRFYILHRDSRPISNILIAELDGVGILGHVFTRPEHRQKGAMRQLMTRQMDDFRARGGQALFLGTGFDRHPYRLYQSFGFRGIEDQSGYMDFYTASREAFEAQYFARGRAEIVPLDWTHWPSSPPLLMADVPGTVRCAPEQMFGRGSTECCLVPLLREEAQRREKGLPPRAMVLRSKRTRAVVGLAMWGDHPLWPDTRLVDVFCHPDFWRKGGDLLAALELPPAARYIAYGDAECPQKHRLLRAAGFRKVGKFVRRLAADTAKTRFVDVIEFEKP